MPIESIEQLTNRHIEQLHALYRAEWWTQDRQLEDVRHMLQHSDVVIALAEADTGQLAGFARVLTDYVYKALIFDVIVAEPQRGQGLGRVLMEAILNHAELQSVRHFELYCLPDMMPFYQQWGFTADLGKLRFLRKDVKDARSDP